MIDSFVLLTPLLLLLLLVPFVFVGCGLDAVGTRLGVAYLSFDNAIHAQQHDDLSGTHAVTQLAVHSITVYWTLRGDELTMNPTTPTQTKGALGAPLATGDSPISLAVASYAYETKVKTIECRCELLLDQGGTMTTNDAVMVYTTGTDHHFRLVRGIVTHPIPSITVTQAPFFVVADTEKN